MTNNIKTSTKLYLLVFVMAVFIIGIGAYGIIVMKIMKQNTQTIYADRVIPLQQLTSIRYYYAVGILSTAEQVQTFHVAFREAADRIQTAQKNISAEWKAYMLTYLTPEENRLADQTSSLMDKSADQIEKLKRTLNKEDLLTLDNIIKNELYQSLNPVLAKITELIDLQVRVSGEVDNNNNKVYSTAIRKFLTLIILSLFFAIPFSYYLLKNVKELIRDLRSSNLKISESEEKYRNIFENVLDVFFQTSVTGVVLDASPSLKNHTGFLPDEVIGSSVANLYYDPSDREEGLVLLLEKGELIDYELKLKSNAGEPVYVSLNARLICDAGGNPSHIDGVFRNITERKRAEEMLKRSEVRLNEAQTIAHMGNWDIDMVNDIHIWSDQLYKLFGAKKEEVQPSVEALLSFMHADDLTGAQQKIQEAFVILTNSNTNFRFVRKDGVTRYAYIEWRFEFDKNKHPIRLFGILQDITERKLAERSIKQSEANYRQLFKLSPAPMWVFDEETFKFIQVNQACINHYGYSEEEFAGMKIMDITTLKEEAGIKEIVKQKDPADTFFIGGHRHVKKSGEIIDVEISSIPVILNGEKRILVIAIDVTEKNLYEQKLTRAAIKAQEDERYEIGGELHDNVCQILASSMLFLSMIKNNLPQESKSYFDKTHEYINLATQEIRNLSHRLAPAFFDNETLEDAFKNLLANFNVEEKYDIILDFNEFYSSYPVGRDLQLNLYRILQEQLRNISKHANATRIEVVVATNDEVLQVGIADNGSGFDVESSRGGIGFANMNRRVQLFSGEFIVNSTVGNGCQVLVEVPLSEQVENG